MVAIFHTAFSNDFSLNFGFKKSMKFIPKGMINNVPVLV